MKTIYNGGFIPDLAIQDVEGKRFFGWLFIKHPDGNWVSLAPIDSMATVVKLTKELEEANKWKIAVIDRAIVNWSYKKEHETDPRLAMNDVLNAEIQMALDPNISKPAKDLVNKGNAKLQAEVDRLHGILKPAANVYEKYKITMCHLVGYEYIDSKAAYEALQSSDSGEGEKPTICPHCGLLCSCG